MNISVKPRPWDRLQKYRDQGHHSSTNLASTDVQTLVSHILNSLIHILKFDSSIFYRKILFFMCCVHVQPDSFIRVNMTGSTAAAHPRLHTCVCVYLYLCCSCANQHAPLTSAQCTVPAWQVLLSFVLFLEGKKIVKPLSPPKGAELWGLFF